MTKPDQSRPTRFHGERSRWLVPSDSEPVPHFVDMDEYGGIGWCSCAHFQFRLQPKLERKENILGEEDLYRCKHLRRVLDEMARLKAAESKPGWKVIPGEPVP